MFERFTDRARRSVVLAQEEAARLRHNFIGTEHLLLGLIAEGEGVAAKALTELGIGLERVRADVEQLIGAGPESPKGNIPFTPRAKKVMELSLKEALGLGHNYIGTEHILLGLVREGEGVAAQVLIRSGVGLDTAREKVIQILSGYVKPTPVPVSDEPMARMSPALKSALHRARVLVGDGEMFGTHHVLAVLTDMSDAAASQILEAGGFDREALPTAIDAWDVSGTGDEDPVERAARGTVVISDSDGFTVRIDDENLRRRIADAIAEGDVSVDDLRDALGRLWAEFLGLGGQTE